MGLKFYNKNGSLTAYSFACGYIEREEKNGRWKKMWMEYRHYHVMSGKTDGCYDYWECFDQSLTQAREAYNKIKL